MPDVKPRTGALPISELIQEASTERFDRKRAASRATRNVLSASRVRPGSYAASRLLKNPFQDR